MFRNTQRQVKLDRNLCGFGSDLQLDVQIGVISFGTEHRSKQ